MRKFLLTTTACMAPGIAMAADDDGSNGIVAGIIVVGLALYLLPTMIGVHRDIAASTALFLVNLLVGWTVAGWFVCLIWAALGKTQEEELFFRNAARKARQDLTT
jgi:TM2 domain-containing membrane protein YozV